MSLWQRPQVQALLRGQRHTLSFWPAQAPPPARPARATANRIGHILRKHGYPPDKQEKATQTVLEQAEVLSETWASA